MPSGINETGGGRELTAEQVVAMLVEPLMAQSVVLAAGPRMFTSSGGAPVRVPTIVEYPIGTPGASPTAGGSDMSYWYGENELIEDTDPEFGEVTLLPSNLKSIKVLHRFSNELARLAVVDIADALRDAIVRRVALAVDRAFLLGDGANNTVRGIVNTPGIIVPTPYGTLEVDDLHDAIGEALAANASPSVWFMHPDAFTTLRKQREGAGTGAYLLQPDPTAENVFRLLGLPVKVTTQLPPGTIVLADMSQVAVARDVDASVRLLDQTFGQYDQLALRVVTRMDIALLNPEGVVRLTAA
jgi:HK97 family phage major capsid protein